MNLQELDTLIVQWGLDRMIIQHSTPFAQLEKTGEEVKELIESFAAYKALYGTELTITKEFHLNEIKDAIGDIYVTLVIGHGIYTRQGLGLFILGDQTSERDPVTKLQAMLTEAAFYAGAGLVRRYSEAVQRMTGLLQQICETYDTTLEECVEQAYNEIKDRKGYLNDQGIFVKEQA
jgi:hypothetical protein